jgi:hypothetical protein
MDSQTAVAARTGAGDPGLAEPGDMKLLGRLIGVAEWAGADSTSAAMGYKQELRRQYSTVQIFAVAFSIMGLVPSIASTISFSLPAGPVGMVWVSLQFRMLSTG